MNRMNIERELFALQDKEYAAFQAKLTPTVSAEYVIGVRVPDIRKLAKNIIKDDEYAAFLQDLPHRFYDENMLHAALLSEFRDYDSCVMELDRFLPFVDNWAVCDTITPKCMKKNKEKLLGKIREWTASEHVYTCRFGMKMLMTWYLDADFREEYLEIPASVHSDEYYVNMMIAWFYATALAKQWEAVLPYLENNRLDRWTHNKTIQKAKESYRISTEQKKLLSLLKR